MRGVWLLFALFVVVLGKKNFKGHQVLRITPAKDEQIGLFKELSENDHLGLDFWTGPFGALPFDVHVPVHSLQAVRAFLAYHKIHYKIMIEDLQDLLDEEQHEMLKSKIVPPRRTDDYNYSAYHTLNEINDFIDMLVRENPGFVSKEVIGQSYEGRPLNVLKFSTGAKRPGLWIDSGIHAREWVTQASGTLIAKKIATDYRNDRALANILSRYDIFLEIVVNPDGYEFTHTRNRLWRKSRKPNPGSNCTGVDLNRNWDAGFNQTTKNDIRNCCKEVYQGPRPHSEPEVRAIVDFIRSHCKIKAFVSLHSYSQLLLYPYGYTRTPCRDMRELKNLANVAVTALRGPYNTQYRYGSIITTIYQATGCSIDWVYNQGIKYSYVFELKDTGEHGFLLPADQIIPTAGEAWLAIKAIMIHAKNNPY